MRPNYPNIMLWCHYHQEWLILISSFHPISTIKDYSWLIGWGLKYLSLWVGVLGAFQDGSVQAHANLRDFDQRDGLRADWIVG